MFSHRGIQCIRNVFIFYFYFLFHSSNRSSSSKVNWCFTPVNQCGYIRAK